MSTFAEKSSSILSMLSNNLDSLDRVKIEIANLRESGERLKTEIKLLIDNVIDTPEITVTESTAKPTNSPDTPVSVDTLAKPSHTGIGSDRNSPVIHSSIVESSYPTPKPSVTSWASPKSPDEVGWRFKDLGPGWSEVDRNDRPGSSGLKSSPFRPNRNDLCSESLDGREPVTRDSRYINRPCGSKFNSRKRNFNQSYGISKDSMKLSFLFGLSTNRTMR